jgi:hypothetical protein
MLFGGVRRCSRGVRGVFDGAFGTVSGGHSVAGSALMNMPH